MPSNTQYIVIPAYKPLPLLLDLVQELVQYDFNLLVIDDGSGDEYAKIFDQISLHSNVHVLTHKTNIGKGAALKSAFKYIHVNDKTAAGCITVDADGQHLVEDILRISNFASENPQNFLMGVREFSEDVPLRSKFGNVLTLYILRILYGLSLADSQTGLRYIPANMFLELEKLKGQRYEFELQCLLRLHELKKPITQIPITTVYVDHNASSHFRPIVDSYRIYKVFLKFSLSSIISFAIDIATFSVALAFSGQIMFSTIFARIVSGCFNFYLNRNYVFNQSSRDKISKQAIGYLSLWLILMVTSGWLVSLLSGSSGSQIVAFKILVDLSLFLISYHVQKRIIFR